jgi:phage-related tail fiber protein
MDRATAAVRLLAGDKEPVRAATTANVALSGLLTVDGVTLVAGDRVLVKDQTDATENGVYTASAGTWYRAPDSNSSRVLIKGMKVAVQEGTIHAGQVWNLVTNRPNLGDDDIEWEFYLSSDMVTQINNAADQCGRLC